MKRAQFATIVFVLALTFIFAISSRNSAAANQNVGYPDFSFGSAPGGDATADKPQSKLWYTTEGNTTTWWAVMFNGSVGRWRIHKLNWPSQWVDTGVNVDDRATSRADVLWDNNTKKLYIVSLVRLSSSNQSRLYRYTYSGGTYTLDSGYPVVVMKTDSSTPDPVTGSAETMAFDKDSTGRLWITFTQNKKVWVNSNPDDGKDWSKPFVLPNSSAIGSDDISSVVAYNDKNGPSIGVLWSNHTTTSADSMMNFSYHKDSDPPGTWQPIESIYGGKGTGTCLADDHINLKSLQADPSGALFAAVKTSVGDSSSCTGGTDLIRLVVRNPTTNTWKWAAFGGTAENHTRPIVLLDTTTRTVYMFATAPESCGIIYMKTSKMDNLSFPAGKGTPFISSSTNTCINNATSTKQTVNANTGLVVMASDKNSQNYLHNIQEIGGSSATATPTTAVTNTPTATPTTAATNTPTATPVPGSTATPTSTPGGWNSQDIGTATGGSSTTSGTSVTVTGAGSDIWGSADSFHYTWQPSSVTVTGAGSDIWGSADSFHYTWQPFSGDVLLTAKLTQWNGGGNSWAKGGLMLRGSTAANAANCFVLVSGGNGIRMQWRAATGGSSANTTTGISFVAPTVSAPLWLRLSLSGTSCSAFYSTNGSDWIAVGTPQAIGGLGSSYLYGLAITAHDTTKLASATFDAIWLIE